VETASVSIGNPADSDSCEKKIAVESELADGENKENHKHVSRIQVPSSTPNIYLFKLIPSCQKKNSLA
jgi:hypothetical protein